MNKELIISHFAASLVCLILAAILMHFVGDSYTLLLGFLAGIGQKFVQPKAKKIIFKGE